MELSDQFFMKKALQEANKAMDENEIPIGAIVVSEGIVIGKGYNQTERLQDVTAHAEMLAITAAANYLGSKYLKDCTLYVTVEPCAMCATAIKHSQLQKVVFGAPEPKMGYRLYQPNLLGKVAVEDGIEQTECAHLMTSFFKNIRKGS